MKSILILLLLIMTISCNSDPQQPNTEDKLTTKTELKHIDETGFIHTVFFWMNEGVTESEKANFNTKGLGGLMKINSIYKGYHGPPAMTPREVVDNSYDFALVCHFKNEKDHNLYQEDKVHLAFIEAYKHLWKDVVVYDNLITK